jgi:hypothetical protein
MKFEHFSKNIRTKIALNKLNSQNTGFLEYGDMVIIINTNFVDFLQENYIIGIIKDVKSYAYNVYRVELQTHSKTTLLINRKNMLKVDKDEIF